MLILILFSFFISFTYYFFTPQLTGYGLHPVALLEACILLNPLHHNNNDDNNNNNNRPAN